MVEKFVEWFIVFGLGFLIEWLGFTTQEKAFFVMHLLIGFFILVIAFVAFLSTKHKTLAAISGVAMVIEMFYFIIPIFATWIATKLFDVDFFVAYQIMTFGQCLVSESKEDDENQE